MHIQTTYCKMCKQQQNTGSKLFTKGLIIYSVLNIPKCSGKYKYFADKVHMIKFISSPVIKNVILQQL